MPPPTLSAPRALPGQRLTESSPFLKFLFYGQAGSGKTWLVLSFAQDPRFQPMLWCDLTGGTSGVLVEAEKAGATVQRIEGLGDVAKVLDYLKSTPDHGYKSVVFDDFTEAFNAEKAIVAREKTGVGSAERLEWQGYATLYERTTDKVRNATKLVARPVEAGGAGVHVIFTAWADKKEDQKEAVEKWHPQFSGQYGFGRLAQYFDIAGYLDHTVKTVREGGTQRRVFSNQLIMTSGGHVCRDRFNITENGVIEMPTGTKILDAIAARGHRIG